MAGVAGLSKSAGHVIRIGGALEVFHVARHARRGRQVVIVVCMAIGALTWRNRVLPRKREAGCAVVEVRIRPTRRAVALPTLGVWEDRFSVLRIIRASVIGLVAGEAGCARQRIIIVDVAIGALPRGHRVHASERKSRGIVIEFRIQPVIACVARLAVLNWECLRSVLRIRGVQIIRLVARVTIRRHRFKLAIRRILVARITVNRGMRSRQGESIVVILNLLHRDLPAAHAMTLLAIRSQLPPVDICVAILAALSNVAEYWLNVALGAGHRGMHAS